MCQQRDGGRNNLEITHLFDLFWLADHALQELAAGLQLGKGSRPRSELSSEGMSHFVCGSHPQRHPFLLTMEMIVGGRCTAAISVASCSTQTIKPTAQEWSSISIRAAAKDSVDSTAHYTPDSFIPQI